MDLTAAELMVLGIGGSVLIGTCVVETPIVLSVRLLAFISGCIMLAIAVICMLFGNQVG